METEGSKAIKLMDYISTLTMNRPEVAIKDSEELSVKLIDDLTSELVKLKVPIDKELLLSTVGLTLKSAITNYILAITKPISK